MSPIWRRKPLESIALAGAATAERAEVDRNLDALLAPQYVPDPDEEAWYASAEGLRTSARNLRDEAARMIERAVEMESRADAL